MFDSMFEKMENKSPIQIRSKPHVSAAMHDFILLLFFRVVRDNVYHFAAFLQLQLQKFPSSAV